jgi:Asp-tRNA(Asn)/Glu-tRNA(Gln) amidotransferase A subunit family amidase
LHECIAQARAERNGKTFHVLTLPAGEAAPADETLSAAETTRQIHHKKLDLLDTLVRLSRRFRNYGRSKQINAITEELYDEAYHQAQQLCSSSQENNDKPLFGFGSASKEENNKPFFGVPISVKDCIAIQGRWAAGGMACQLTKKIKRQFLIGGFVERGWRVDLGAG